MNRQVIVTRRARRDLQNLDRVLADRIVRAIYRYAETDLGDVIPLRGREDEWRLRVGQWRVLFTFDEPNQSMVILRVLPRGSAYRP